MGMCRSDDHQGTPWEKEVLSSFLLIDLFLFIVLGSQWTFQCGKLCSSILGTFPVLFLGKFLSLHFLCSFFLELFVVLSCFLRAFINSIFQALIEF